MDAGITINCAPRDGHMAFVRSPGNISIALLKEGDHLPPRNPEPAWKTPAIGKAVAARAAGGMIPSQE